MWEQFNERFGIGAAVVSHSLIGAVPAPEFDEELGRYVDAKPPEHGLILEQEYPNRGPVLVDEAHNFRNINQRSRGLRDYLDAGIAEEVNINATGVMMGTCAAIDALRRRGGGVIINTASIAAEGNLAFDAMYSASKKAVVSFTQSCAPLKESENIRVNAASPAMVQTAFQRKTGDGTRPASWLLPSIERAGDNILQPEAIAEAVLDFIRDDSKAGEVRTVSGP